MWRLNIKRIQGVILKVCHSLERVQNLMRHKDLVRPIRAAHSKPKRRILSLTPHITRRMSVGVLQYIHDGLGQAASPPSLFVSSSREHLVLVLAEGRAPVDPRGIQVEPYSPCYPYVFVAAPTNMTYLCVRRSAEAG